MSRIHVLLTGSPGVGKTTAIKSIVEILERDCLTVGGFYTEEVRQANVRVGFDVVAINGCHRASLARRDMSDTSGNSRKPMVGNYTVDVDSFESISLRALTIPISDAKIDVMVIDEVGKMEVFSKTFQKSVNDLFTRNHCVMLATIPAMKGSKTIPLVDSLVAMPNTRVYEVTQKTRDSLVDEIVKVIKECLMVR